MPPRNVTKESSTSTSSYRRSKRICTWLKSVRKEQLASLKEQSSSSAESPRKRRRLMGPRNVTKESSTSTSSFRRSERICTWLKSVRKEQLASLKEKSSSSTKSPRKRRLMETDEVSERTSLTEQQDFSEAVQKILAQLSPDLKISKECLVDMNVHLNNVYKCLIKKVESLAKIDACITVKDIEAAIATVVGGNLAKYCIAEGRRAVKEWKEMEYEAVGE